MTPVTKTTRARRTSARATSKNRQKNQILAVDATPLREIWLAGLGAVATTGEAASGFVDLLVAKGRETEPRLVASAERTLISAKRSATRTVDELGERAKSAIEDAMQRLGVGNRARTKNMLHRLGDLAEAIL